MQLFAQISDPHLSSLAGVRWQDLLNKRALGYLSWRRRRRFEHRAEVLDALQRDLQQFDVDQLLVTGDLTHLGLPLEFRQALTWLQRLGSPDRVVVIPGNHDASVAAPWDATFALWRDYMASDQPARGDDNLFPSLRVRGSIAFIGLSTACPKPPLMATGTVSAGQLERLPELLEATRERGLFRVVHLHHCPLPGREKWRKRLTNARQVARLLVDHGAELVLYGHGHRARYDELATAHGMAPVIGIPSASALGLHGHDVAAYNCYQLASAGDGWQLQVHTRQYQPCKAAFTGAGSTTISLVRHP
ncbi:MAG: metallophosphoesterase [Halieaceae bacterium]|nr:metallophosphoesterase [Halieaceae bacterium]